MLAHSLTTAITGPLLRLKVAMPLKTQSHLANHIHEDSEQRFNGLFKVQFGTLYNIYNLIISLILTLLFPILQHSPLFQKMAQWKLTNN